MKIVLEEQHKTFYELLTAITVSKIHLKGKIKFKETGFKIFFPSGLTYSLKGIFQ